MSIGILLAGASVAVWAYLLLARGGFWRAGERDDSVSPTLPATALPAVTAVIPARDEADVVGHAVASLLSQDGIALDVVLVDDQSSDGTAAAARRAAVSVGAASRLTVIDGRALPAGWTGKLWALQQGIDHVLARPAPAAFLLLTDADIAYAPGTIAGLLAEALSKGLVLDSRMAKLRCSDPAERLLIPAFIFFFQKLYPFAWVNRPGNHVAAAAGGCMLLRREALLAAGGIESIRRELIDDCALARRLKAQGPIRLMLTERVRSLRPYARIGEIRRMVARSAYAQLRFSPLLLAGTLAGMALTYLAPPLLVLLGSGITRLLGFAAWAAMAYAFQPTLRFYRLSWWWGAALPAIAALYFAFTLDSAWQHWRGRGGFWKGRTQAPGLGGRVTAAEQASSGKGHRDENFPVASWLIAPRHRPVILAFYRFVRAADDVADHATLAPDEKLALIDRLERSLLGREDSEPAGVALRAALAERRLPPRHALDLLTAFRLDVTKLSYADWNDLMDYCAFSAMPVGRFVLDVHGEPRSIWPASDALCAALQVINHLQDCGADYRDLRRVYIPRDAFAGAGTGPEALAEPQASAALLACIQGLAKRTAELLQEAAPFARLIANHRLALEVAVIHRLARRLTHGLMQRDPLSQRVHLSGAQSAPLALLAMGQTILARLFLRAPMQRAPGHRP